MHIVHLSLHFSHHFRSHPLQHPGQDCWSRHRILCVKSQCPTIHLDHYTHSFSLTLSSLTYLYLSRLVGEVPSGPSEPRREVFPHLLSAAGWSSTEFLGMLSSSARSVPVHGPPLFHSHPTQIHCCWTIRWRGWRATHFYNMDWTLWRE